MARLALRLGSRALRVLATALAVTMISSGVAQAAGDPQSPTRARVSWSDCWDGFQCAVIRVPLDYRNPAGRTIALALIRLPATDPARRIGSLFVNPGGPGGSGVGFVRGAARLVYTPEIRARFDIIGMDPRGVGASTPVRCYDNPAAEAAFEADYPTFPVTPEENASFARKGGELAANCWARSGWQLPHLSTANVARDLDLVRDAVGDRQLTYAGYSYGTYLGATYANMFPDRVRALILDGAVDPTQYAPQLAGALGAMPFLRQEGDVASFRTLKRFFALCAQAPGTGCAFGAGGDPAAKFDTIARRLRAQPVTVSTPTGSTRIGYAEVVAVTTAALYQASGWPRLAKALQDLYLGQGEAVAAILRHQRTPQYIDESGISVLCSEVETTHDPLAFPAIAGVAAQRAPYVGELWAYAGEQCAHWPRLDPDRYLGPWNHDTAAPVLVIGTRFDPATPYDNAVALAGVLPNSRLLTEEGYGHTAVMVSSCVDQAVERYLTSAVLPAVGAVCQPDRQPFA